MNFDPEVETFTQFLIRINELADNAFLDKGKEFVDEMLFGILPQDIRNRLIMNHKEHLGKEKLREYVNRLTESITPRGDKKNPMSHLMNQMTQNTPQGQKPVMQNTSNNKVMFNGNC